MSMPRLPLLLRTIAVAIAAVALLDPAVTVPRVGRPIVAVITPAPARDSAGAAMVAAVLRDRFRVIPAPFAGADATILVGNRPGPSGDPAVRFVVLPRRAADIAIETLDAPGRAAVHGRVPVGVALRVRGLKGATIDLRLTRDGEPADLVTLPVASDDTLLHAQLSFIPSRPGPVALRLLAGRSGAAPLAVGDVAVDLVAERHPVLVHAPRPSWMATFLRRALEDDGAFVVTSRSATAGGISTDVGAVPSLGDAEALRRFAVVLIGAPDALGEGDVAGLERYLRAGGTVVFLPDDVTEGTWRRLTAVTRWSRDSSRVQAVPWVASDSLTLRASSLVWPAVLPAGARAIATTGGPTPHPIVWTMPLGPGRLVVNGALDSWSYRDPALSTFGTFWRQLVGDLAATAIPPVDVRIAPTVVAPGESAEILVRVAGSETSGPAGTQGWSRAVTAVRRDIASGTEEPVALYPTGAPGELAGRVTAPADTGRWSIRVAAGAASGEAILIARPGAVAVRRGAEPLTVLAGTASGGRGLTLDRLADLPSLVADAVAPVARPTRWRPMQSLWWLFPFSLALGAEWWLRRRRGLP